MASISITPLHSDRTQCAFFLHLASGERRSTVHTTVTRQSAVVRDWIHSIRRLLRRHLHHLVVGLGVQWSPSSKPIPAVLNLCVGRRCLLFQLTRSTSIPNLLKRFLAEQQIRFASVGVRYDCRLLWEGWGLRVANGFEIRALASNMMGRRNALMHNMARVILQLEFVEMAKTEMEGRSNWEVPILSHKQIIYASVDAYVSFLLGLRLL